MRKLYLLFAVTLAFSTLRANNGFGSHASNSRDSRTTSPVSNIAREDEYDVKFYWLSLDIEAANSFIIGNALTQAQVVASAGMDTFALELDGTFTIDSAEVQINNGGFETATVVRGGGTEVDVLLPSLAAMGDVVGARVYYRGTAAVSPDGYPSGYGFFTGPPNYSASPPYNSSTWWPCKQNLTDKADSSWFFVTTDTPSIAACNGLLTNTVTVAGGKKQYQWKSNYPIDFYLISFVVGEMTYTTQYFHPVGRQDSMIVEYYNQDPSYTLNVLKLFSEKFGLYPFYKEKFGLAGVNLGGGMENQTLVSLGFSGSVIEHETTHQWFGDNVTCASYKELWLNEGFARWGESLYPELAAPDSASANAARINIANQYETGNLLYGAEGGLAWPSSSIYYYNTDTVDIQAVYGGQGRDMNYEKAAMMINSLRFLINNDSLFFLGLRNYQNLYKGQAAHTNDFMDAMENTVDMDLTQFFNQWFWGYGFPQFNIRWNQGQNTLAVEVTEHASDSLKTPLFQTPVQIKAERLFHADTGWARVDTTFRVFVSQNDSNFYYIPSGNADSIIGFVVDPNQWILNKAGTVTQDTSINIVVATGIAPIQLANTAFAIYPNPTTDYLNIHSNLPYGQPVDAELFNEMGQRVLQQTIKPYDKVSLNGLPAGVYFLQLNHLYSYKVVVTN